MVYPLVFQNVEMASSALDTALAKKGAPLPSKSAGMSRRSRRSRLTDLLETLILAWAMSMLTGAEKRWIKKIRSAHRGVRTLECALSIFVVRA